MYARLREREEKPLPFLVDQETEMPIDRRISGRYEIESDKGVRFVIAAYDRSKALIVDPALVYST
jgi:hypothetical protein